MEEFAIILDYLPQGLAGNFGKSSGPICYAVGIKEFKLFELTVKPGARINIDDEVFIGKEQEKRTQIEHVKRRVSYEQMTAAAQAELEPVIRDIVVNKYEEQCVKFYNNAQPISLKVHILEKLPGMGKKTLGEFLQARADKEKGPFKSFDDIKERVPSMKDPAKFIVDRIVLEISDHNRRNYLFVKN